jgi:hypothetical protein
LGILLIVVAIGAPRGVLSLAEFGAGAVLICLAVWLLVPTRKHGVALKDLPWIKPTKKGNGSDSNSSAWPVQRDLARTNQAPSRLGSVLTRDDPLKRQAQDPEIQSQAQILRIPYIKLDLSGDIHRAALLVKLSPSKKTRLDLVTMAVTRYPRSIIVMSLIGERPRPNEGKITAQEIEQLWQAVKIWSRQNSADCIFASIRKLFGAGCFISGAEGQQIKWESVLASARPPDERPASEVSPGAKGADQQQGWNEYDRDERGQNVDCALDSIVAYRTVGVPLNRS